jgi:hypothetical protein
LVIYPRKTLFLFTVLFIFYWASPAHALKKMLIYGPTAGCYADSTPGFSVTAWNTTQWASATTAQFAAFDVIVIADCSGGSTSGSCFTDPSIWSTAISTESVWSPAVTGNVLVIGSDPDFHGKASVVQQLVTFAGSGTGTGLYVALSCPLASSSPNTPVPLLAGFGTFTVEGLEGSSGCSNAAHIISTSPALTGMTDSALSNWNCSVHEGFDSWPSSFTPLAIATDAINQSYTAPDGTTGIVYILARGVTYIPTPTPTYTITPTATLTPCGYPGNTCTPTFTPTLSPTFTPTPTLTPCGYPGNTCTPTLTPTISPTPMDVFYVSKNIFNANQEPVSIYVSFNQYPGNYSLSIYNSAGEFIANLDNQRINGGYENLYHWDGTNQNKEKCANGVYIIYLIEPLHRKIARVLLIRR